MWDAERLLAQLDWLAYKREGREAGGAQGAELPHGLGVNFFRTGAWYSQLRAEEPAIVALMGAAAGQEFVRPIPNRHHPESRGSAPGRRAANNPRGCPRADAPHGRSPER